MQKVLEALETFAPDAYPTNKQVIAECIRRELAEARACGDAAVEAEQRVREMISNEFKHRLRVVEPFKIFDALNLTTWRIIVQYPVGAALVVEHYH